MGNAPVRKILVAEDDEFSLKLIGKLLALAGYTVSKARDGAQALDLLSREQFALLITDVNMPRMGGLRLLEEVKKKYHIPAIVVTASDIDSDTQRRSYSLGAVRFIIKPVDQNELLNAVKEVLGKES
jgi:two-component system chemotaxis response regulator CheY